MNTVWIVEEGMYSNRQIVGVFTTKEKAHAMMDAVKDAARSGEIMIEEVTLDPEAPQAPPGCKLWDATMRADGSRAYAELLDPDSAKDKIKEICNAGLVPRDQWCTWTGWAKDEAHAIKQCNDQRVQAIAAGNWGHP